MQTLFSDMNQLPPSNGNHMPAKYCESEETKDGSQDCKCMKETSDCLTHPNTPEKWTASMRDSLAKILAQQEKALESREQEADLLVRSSAQLTLFDPSLFSSKTPQRYEPEDGMWFSANWWREDTPTGTESLPRLMLGPVTSGLGGGAWPTPTAQDNIQIKGKDKRGTTLGGAVRMWPTPCLPGNGGSNGKRKLSQMMFLTPRASDTGKGEKSETFVKRMGDRTENCFQSLAAQVQNLPTPTTRDWKSGTGAKPREGSANPLSSVIGGQLNPPWVEWLMGWPIGWTELKRLGTAKFRSKRRRPGVSLVDQQQMSNRPGQ